MYKSDLGVRFGTIRHLYIVYMREPPPKGGIAPSPPVFRAEGEGGALHPQIFLDPPNFFGGAFRVEVYNTTAKPLRCNGLRLRRHAQCNIDATASLLMSVNGEHRPPLAYTYARPDAHTGARIGLLFFYGFHEVKTK